MSYIVHDALQEGGEGKFSRQSGEDPARGSWMRVGQLDELECEGVEELFLDPAEREVVARSASFHKTLGRRRITASECE